VGPAGVGHRPGVPLGYHPRQGTYDQAYSGSIPVRLQFYLLVRKFFISSLNSSPTLSMSVHQVNARLSLDPADG
jgi:hypothetical protein